MCTNSNEASLNNQQNRAIAVRSNNGYPVILCVIHHRQNHKEYTGLSFALHVIPRYCIECLETSGKV
jgi:hypothetical protein